MSRPQNMGFILDYYYNKLNPHPFEIRWLIGQQCNEPDPKGAEKADEMIDLIPENGWFLTVADDTVCHPSLLARIGKIIEYHPQIGAIVFTGVRDGNGTLLAASPNHMSPGRVCGSQLVWNKSLVGENRFDFFKTGGQSDGILIQKLYNESPEQFLFVDEPLTYFGYMEWE